jgi:hypothetical protein
LRAKLAAADDALRQSTSAWETEKKELCEEMDERSRQHKSVVAEKQAQQSSYDEAAAAAAHERARLAAQARVRMQSTIATKICICFPNCQFSNLRQTFSSRVSAVLSRFDENFENFV